MTYAEVQTLIAANINDNISRAISEKDIRDTLNAVLTYAKDNSAVLSPKGAFSYGTNYFKNDVVSESGAAYVAKADNSNQPISNTAFWTLLLPKGDIGPSGIYIKSTQTPETIILDADAIIHVNANTRRAANGDYTLTLVLKDAKTYGIQLIMDQILTSYDGLYAKFSVPKLQDEAGNEILQNFTNLSLIQLVPQTELRKYAGKSIRLEIQAGVITKYTVDDPKSYEVYVLPFNDTGFKIQKELTAETCEVWINTNSAHATLNPVHDIRVHGSVKTLKIKRTLDTKGLANFKMPGFISLANNVNYSTMLAALDVAAFDGVTLVRNADYSFTAIADSTSDIYRATEPTILAMDLINKRIIIEDNVSFQDVLLSGMNMGHFVLVENYKNTVVNASSLAQNGGSPYVSLQFIPPKSRCILSVNAIGEAQMQVLETLNEPDGGRVITLRPVVGGAVNYYYPKTGDILVLNKYMDLLTVPGLQKKQRVIVKNEINFFYILVEDISRVSKYLQLPSFLASESDTENFNINYDLKLNEVDGIITAYHQYGDVYHNATFNSTFIFKGNLTLNNASFFGNTQTYTINKGNLVKDQILTIINALNTGQVLTVDFGEIPHNMTSATSVLVKRMDASISVAAEQVEFKGCVKFYLDSFLNKFVVIG